MKCSICQHPQLFDINLAILSGNYTLEGLSQKFGPSPSAFQRHKNHLQEKMDRARTRLQLSQEQCSLLKLNAVLDHVQRGVETAAAQGDLDRVFKGAYIASRIIYQINKMDVPLDLETVCRLISTPEFVSQDSLLPTGPQVITGLHQAVVDRAFSPCPDPPPESGASPEDEAFSAADEADDVLENSGTESWLEDEFDGVAEDYEPMLETGNGKSDTESLLAALQLIQRHYPDLELSERTRPDQEPANYRKMTGKLLPKTGHITEKSLEDQTDILNEKISRPRANPGIFGKVNILIP